MDKAHLLNGKLLQLLKGRVIKLTAYYKSPVIAQRSLLDYKPIGEDLRVRPVV